MVRPKPVYNEIRQIRKQLNDFTHYHTAGESSSGCATTSTTTTTGTHSRKQCRMAYTRLLEIFGNARKRQLLNDEAICDEDYDEIVKRFREEEEEQEDCDNDDDDDNDDDTVRRTKTHVGTGVTSASSHNVRPVDMDMDDDDDDDDADDATRHHQQRSTPIRIGTTHHHRYHWISRSIRARQRLALSEMWKSLVTTSLQCTLQLLRWTTSTNAARPRKRKYTNSSSISSSTTTTTTTKYHEEDLNFPFKLLKLCYHFDPIFDESFIPPPLSSSSATTSDYVHHLSPHASFIPSKLGREQAKLLYQYCTAVIADIDQDREDQRVRNEDSSRQDTNNNNNNNNIDAVEKNILSMLAFICGKRELVATYYKPIPHIRHILIRIVQPRILQLALQPPSTTTSTIPQQQIMLTACKIWYTLFHTCTIDYIGIGLQTLIPEAFDIFASWCRQQKSVYHISSPVLLESSTYILNAMTILMKHDRDLCIASLQRHGYVLLPFLKASYREYQQQRLKFTSTNHVSHSSIVMALHDFLLQYLYVQTI